MTEPARPNILWITTHDINPDLGCYAGVWPGAEYAHTPNLDQLAAEGARYDNAFAVAPVCAPSRSAIITGMYPHCHRHDAHALEGAAPPPEVRCFPEYLRAAGYYCTNNAFSDLPVSDAGDGLGRLRPAGALAQPPGPGAALFRRLPRHADARVADLRRRRGSSGRTPPRLHARAAARSGDGARCRRITPILPCFARPGRATAINITAMDYWAGDLLRQLEDDGLADDTLGGLLERSGAGMPRAKRWPYDSGLHEPLLRALARPDRARTRFGRSWSALMDLAADDAGGRPDCRSPSICTPGRCSTRRAERPRARAGTSSATATGWTSRKTPSARCVTGVSATSATITPTGPGCSTMSMPISWPPGRSCAGCASKRPTSWPAARCRTG